MITNKKTFGGFMKESRNSIKILGSVLFANLLAVLFLSDQNYIYKILSVSFGGVAVSWLVSIITYNTGERNSLYNFYVAAERYIEKLKCFSEFLVDSFVCLDKEENECNKKKIMDILVNRSEEICDKLYEEFIIMQREIREFEAYSYKFGKRHRIEGVLRKIYGSSREILIHIRNCDELNYHNKLTGEENCKEVISKYNELYAKLIEKDKDKNSYILIKCKHLDCCLEEFISLGYISLRKKGNEKKSTEYKSIFDNGSTVVDAKFSTGIVPKERSICHRPISDRSEDAWMNDL